MEETNEKRESLEDKTVKANLSQDEIIKQRKERVIKFFKTRYSWIVYLFLAFIVFLAVKIRTMPMGINPATGKPKLWDITTDYWTLGPDLDPFLFLRWAEYIVEHGKLFAIDTMRSLPLGFDTRGELLLHPYMIAWFHKIAIFFGSDSVTYSAIIYPVFMFALTVIAFFLFTRKIFIDSTGEIRANIIALIASFFLSVIPIFLPRTIAGIPEKESGAFFFMFLAFYFFLSAWRSKNLKAQLILSALAGLSTGAMALIWGGYNYVLLALSSAVFVVFLLGNIDKKKFYAYITWIIFTSLLMWPFSTRYPLISTISRGTVIVAFIILVHFIIFNTKLKKYIEGNKLSRLPQQLTSLIVALIILSVLASLIFGFNYIPNRISGTLQNIISPISSRLIFTVAENRQPFFTEWVGSFGPFIKNIPIFFWLFLLGSVYLFYKLTNPFQLKERFYLTLSYMFLIIAIPYSRYSSNSRFNGETTASLFLYGAGFLVFILVAGFYYYTYNKKNEQEKFKHLDFNLILLLVISLLGLVSARGLIRLVMVLAPSASILVAYFVVTISSDFFKQKGEITKILALILALVIIIAAIFTGTQFHNEIKGQAEIYAPSIYTNQWQKAMAWVRGNTQENAVFSHWWDYGYWIQSIGKRATVLDGGNVISYWNHLMGRYALTGSDKKAALEFLYAHNTTHFLIDSTDIGKYGAFSSIGSDTGYDRQSWMSVFVKDNNQIKETKNGTIYAYGGGTSLDDDITYDNNGTKIFLPGRKAGLGVVLIEQNTAGELSSQPIGIYVYQNQQYRLPLRYIHINGKFHDFGSGIEAGVFLMSRVNQNGNQISIEKNGALLYLSDRTVKSQLARLYLYKEDDPNFKLVHSEDDFLVGQLKSQDPNIQDIVFINGVRGPIRIWEVHYPKDIELKKDYLSTIYPEELEVLR